MQVSQSGTSNQFISNKLSFSKLQPWQYRRLEASNFNKKKVKLELIKQWGRGRGRSWGRWGVRECWNLKYEIIWCFHVLIIFKWEVTWAGQLSEVGEVIWRTRTLLIRHLWDETRSDSGCSLRTGGLCNCVDIKLNIISNFPHLKEVLMFNIFEKFVQYNNEGFILRLNF